MSIIDDYARRVWVFILKHKDHALETFKRWVVLVENQTGKTVKRLRTDNGLEYCSGLYNDYCTQKWMARQHTVGGTPQQNGLAERFNKTILERVRCMLSVSGLPKTFWAEAVKTACYLINRCPSSAIQFKTPQEVWSGKPPKYDNLKIFGCVAYAHVKQSKLDPRAKKCVFLGYPEGVKGYRLWCVEPGAAKVVISRDVTFNETEFYKNLKQQGGESMDRVSEEEIELEVGNEDRQSSESKEVFDQPALEPDVQQQTYNLARDRKRRDIRPPTRYGYFDLIAFAFCTIEELEEPTSYEQAMSSLEKELWRQAMNEEMESLSKNQTWELVRKPDGQKLVSCKWIYKLKEGIPGVEKPRYKARLVARGFTQREGIDYIEVFSPVVKHTSIRLLLALVATQNLELEQLDVKTAFIHGELEETI